MIELELKYKLTNIPEATVKLEKVKTKAQTDIYYDTQDYDLIRKGNFLRVRNGEKLEFKVDLDDASHLYCKETVFKIKEIKQNINEINKVFSAIGIRQSKQVEDFDDFVEKNDLIIIAPIKKVRTEYRLAKNITIAVDEVDDLGLFLEAEIMVDHDDLSAENAVEIKEELVNELLKAKVISSNDEMVNIGYVELYLLKHNKNVYELGKFKI